MLFPDVEAMTPTEQASNEAATQALIQGKYYTFEPAILSTGIATGGPQVHEPLLMNFNRGYYLGVREQSHIFQGTPVNDPRKINSNLRECYFHVLFIAGGSIAQMDKNQNA